MYTNKQVDGFQAMSRREWGKGLECFKEDLAEQGNNVVSLRSMATCTAEMNESEEAYATINFCTQLYPYDADSWMIKGSVASQLSDVQGALDFTNKSLELAPDAPNSLWNKSMFLMKLGYWKEGWALYDWGFVFGHRRGRTLLPMLEKGTPIKDGETVLIWGEQGAGDIIMFLRYVEDFKNRYPNCKLLLEIRWDLIPLLTDYPHATVFCRQDNGSMPYAFDHHISMASLPNYLDMPIPEPRYGYLPKDTRLTEYVKQHIPFSNEKPRVALAWRGSPGHSNDANRSMTYELMQELITDDAQFITLQVGEEIKDDRVLNLNGDINSWAVTAAVLEEIDLVVCVDTSIAHLAGALGKKVLILHPKCMEWRWSGTWYPDVTHIAQTIRRDWTSIIKDAKEWLKITLPGLTRATSKQGSPTQG